MENFVFTSPNLGSFQEFFVNGNFTDTVLVCEKNFIKCHKLLLAASSHYFNELFLMLGDKNPTIVLKDISLGQLTKVLEYIYCGKVTINKNELIEFKKAAEYFQLKIDIGTELNSIDHNSTLTEFMSQETTGNLTIDSFRLHDTDNDSDNESTLTGLKVSNEPELKRIKLADSFGTFSMNLNLCAKGTEHDERVSAKKKRNYFEFSDHHRKKIALDVLRARNNAETRKDIKLKRSCF